MENQEAYYQAEKRLEAKQEFLIHLIVYAVVIVMLIGINLTFSKDTMWVKYPILGWGIGIIFHALNVYVFPKKFQITDEMIREEMDNY